MKRQGWSWARAQGNEENGCFFSPTPVACDERGGRIRSYMYSTFVRNTVRPALTLRQPRGWQREEGGVRRVVRYPDDVGLLGRGHAYDGVRIMRLEVEKPLVDKQLQIELVCPIERRRPLDAVEIEIVRAWCPRCSRRGRRGRRGRRFSRCARRRASRRGVAEARSEKLISQVVEAGGRVVALRVRSETLLILIRRLDQVWVRCVAVGTARRGGGVLRVACWRRYGGNAMAAWRRWRRSTTDRS